MADLEKLKHEILAAIAATTDVAELEAIRVGALGKKGSISELMKGLGAMSPEARKTEGAKLNALRDEIAQALQARRESLELVQLFIRLKEERVDVTLPVSEPQGSVHPVSQVMDEIVAIFADL